eukprot:1715253-Pleurochrysis_carterae.AAC.1
MSTCGFHCYTTPTALATSCTSQNVFPPLLKFLPEISELVREHGLSMTTGDDLAFQTLQTLACEVAPETARLQGLPLLAFSKVSRA